MKSSSDRVTESPHQPEVTGQAAPYHQDFSSQRAIEKQGFPTVVLSSNLKLLSEDFMIRQLSSVLGVGRRGFRRLCQQLQVPMIWTPKGPLIDLEVFIAAFKTISRAGAPDFCLPNCREMIPTGRRKRVRTSISAHEVQAEIPRTIERLRNVLKTTGPAPLPAHSIVIEGNLKRKKANHG